jgi:hypothetical protein
MGQVYHFKTDKNIDKELKFIKKSMEDIYYMHKRYLAMMEKTLKVMLKVAPCSDEDFIALYKAVNFHYQVLSCIKMSNDKPKKQRAGRPQNKKPI